MKLMDLVQKAAQYSGKRIAVAAAEDDSVIESVVKAAEHELASFRLYGDGEKIERLLTEAKADHVRDKVAIVHTEGMAHSTQQAVKAVSSGEADILMKGAVQTATILKEVLNKEYGLRTNNVLSHVAAFEIPVRENLLFITDSAMNITPDLKAKAQIVQNAVDVARSIGIDTPKVAPLAAVEVVNPSMVATIDAAALTQMNARGQITDCVVDGPLGFDNAVSLKAAEQKGIKSEVAGNADILLVPDIETGNSLYKSLVYFAGAKVGGVIAGAKAPVVLTSRADTSESKFYSLALAVCFSTKNR